MVKHIIFGIGVARHLLTKRIRLAKKNLNNPQDFYIVNIKETKSIVATKLLLLTSQQSFTCFKLIIKKLEKSVIYVQS